MHIVPAHVAHARLRPSRNSFAYALCYFAIPLSEWRRGTRSLFFSIDGPNLFSLWSADYGDGGADIAGWISRTLQDQGITEADGEIVLLTLPRLLGYAFNPVSFWLCFGRDKTLRAVLAEVNNTFGERHCYLCVREGQAPILKNAPLNVRKIFHVSPFLEVNGAYRFRFALEADRLGIRIDLLDREGIVLATSMSGRRQTLSAIGLLKAAALYPLQTLKVVALIHYQAVKLLLKGTKRHRKPAPPELFVSR